MYYIHVSAFFWELREGFNHTTTLAVHYDEYTAPTCKTSQPHHVGALILEQ